MQDLDIAKTELYEENLNVCMVKDCKVLFKDKRDPVSGLLDAIDNAGAEIEAASIACRMAGKAVGLLCVYAKTKEVFAAVLTRKALAVFKQYKTPIHWNELVENLLDKKYPETILFEKTAADITEPAKAYKTLGDLRNKMSARPEPMRERFISK